MSAAPRTINLDDAPNTGTTDTPDLGAGPSTAPPRTPSIRKLETQVQEFYAQLGTYVGVMAPDPFAGMMLVANSEAAGSSWADLAAQDATVKRTIEKLLTGGVWANVAGIHIAGIALPILAYYGKLPDQVAGMMLMAVAKNNPELAPIIAHRMGMSTADAANMTGAT